MSSKSLIILTLLFWTFSSFLNSSLNCDDQNHTRYGLRSSDLNNCFSHLAHSKAVNIFYRITLLSHASFLTDYKLISQVFSSWGI